MTGNDDLMRRAYAAYFRNKEFTDQPSQADSDIEEHGGKKYVVLRNVRSVLAVYRVRNDGMLKRLERWPDSIK